MVEDGEETWAYRAADAGAAAGEARVDRRVYAEVGAEQGRRAGAFAMVVGTCIPPACQGKWDTTCAKISSVTFRVYKIRT